MFEWVKSSLWEIKRSIGLQALGAILAFLHILTFLLWRSNATLFATGSPDLCWSAFPNCASLATYDPGHIQFLVMTYLVVSVIALFCFLVRRLLGFAWLMIATAFTLKVIFYLSDAALASNPHILHFAAEFCFLIIPNKGPLIRTIVLSYYLISGGLKLNPSWLSGMWLGEHLPIPTKGLEWVAAFSTLIELIIPFGLFMRAGVRLAIASIILFLYHIFYWFVGGFFEPLTMMAFIVFFILSFIEDRNHEREYMYQSYSRPEPTKLWWPIIFLCFWGFQVVPVLFPKYLKNNPMQVTAHSSPKECYQRTFVTYNNGTHEYADDIVNIFNEEMKCNSFVHFRGAKGLCKKLAPQPEFKNVASYFYVRGFSESQFQRVFEINNFCDPDVNFKEHGGSQ